MNPYIDVSNVPLAKLLQQNYDAIKAEAFNLFQVDGIIPKINATMADQDGRNPDSTGQPKYTGKNSSLHIRVVLDLLDPPERKVALVPGAEANRERRRKLCPVTMGILGQYCTHDQDLIGNIGFNMLFPGAVITPHYGVITASKYVRVHLALEAAEGCVFYAKDPDSGQVIPYSWKNRELMAFHDGAVLHWVEHKGTTPRTIMSVDMKRELVFG